MKIYLVGGAVRDTLLGLNLKERDWVVVGSTPHEMVKKGFQPVGKDFPVFLHPKTHEEYALARTERKTAKGYKGFEFYADEKVTLEEDLKRRDLTINAMAQSEDGKIIDPYHGQQDLKNKYFRHVSPAFSEDPVRILRVARFATQFPDFSVHPDTNALMKTMTTSGEVDALVAERVWKEFSRALAGKKPSRFFDVLSACGAFDILFPELRDHPFSKTLFENTAEKNTGALIRFSVLFSHLPKKLIEAIATRFRIPAEYAELVILVSTYAKTYHALDVRDATQLWEILKKIDAFRRPTRFLQWLTVCDYLNPSGQSNSNLLMRALDATKSVDTQALVNKNLSGLEFAEMLKKLQIEAIRLHTPR